MSRSESGVLTVRFHTDGGPATFTGQLRTDLPWALFEIGEDRDDRVLVLQFLPPRQLCCGSGSTCLLYGRNHLQDPPTTDGPVTGDDLAPSSRAFDPWTQQLRRLVPPAPSNSLNE
ncbi:hypothetical protein [Streptomyces sp. R41]|uniref:Uncharacterized protein n=1 Tax=Streptomyces sp. R41 TaxID=3238632 RepID=A0AB39RXE4_9ACTN